MMRNGCFIFECLICPELTSRQTGQSSVLEILPPYASQLLQAIDHLNDCILGDRTYHPSMPTRHHFPFQHDSWIAGGTESTAQIVLCWWERIFQDWYAIYDYDHDQMLHHRTIPLHRHDPRRIGCVNNVCIRSGYVSTTIQVILHMVLTSMWCTYPGVWIYVSISKFVSAYEDRRKVQVRKSNKYN